MGNKTRNSIHNVLGKVFITASVVFATSMLAATANATTYYISPTGADSNSGTASTSAWKTFAFAIPKLRAGDTLILRNGTYNASNAGYVSIDCATNASNGINGNPITLKAENERQAWLPSDGSQPALRMQNCSWWNIVGLRLSSADNPNSGSNNTDIMLLYHDQNVSVKRSIFSNNNRYTNSHPLDAYSSDSILAEENEFYYYHRHGIIFFHTNNSVARRNYCNSRNYADIPGGYGPTNDTTRGDSCYVSYPGSNNILENNISEGNGAAGDTESGFGASNNNRYLGNISLNDAVGYYGSCRDVLLQNNVVKDLVVIRAEKKGPATGTFAIYPRGESNIQFSNISVFDTQTGGGLGRGFYAALYDVPTCGSPSTTSFTLTNALIVNSPNDGIYVEGGVTGSLDYTYFYNNNLNFTFYTGSKVTNTHSFTTDPGMGTCRVWIPDKSPLKGAGAGGADIGANVLFRYQDGVLQPLTPANRLWDISTGQFVSRGAIVPGLNDIPGQSLYDVNTRLNVNTNGCPFPAAYASGAAVVSSAVTQTSSSSGPVGSWNFDEGSGTSASDASGNGSTGNLLNGPIWTTGVKGTALSFDGADDYVDMGSAPALNITGTGITVQAWAKASTPGNYKYIVSKTDGSSVGYGFYTGDAGSLRFYIGNGSGLIITPDVTSPWDNRWHHLVGTYDGSKLNLYVDGVARASVAATGNIGDSSSRSLNIGRFSDGGLLFKGAIDDVQIYNRALSPTEIQQLYNSVPVVRPSSPVNLIVTK